MCAKRLRKNSFCVPCEYRQAPHQRGYDLQCHAVHVLLKTIIQPAAQGPPNVRTRVSEAILVSTTGFVSSPCGNQVRSPSFPLLTASGLRTTPGYKLDWPPSPQRCMPTKIGKISFALPNTLSLSILQCSAEDWWPAIAHPRTLPFRDVSVDSDKKTVNHTIDALDEEILALRQLTSAISARRNRLVGIHKLPAELLARCFWWLSLINPPETTVQKPPGWSPDEPHWISYDELPRKRNIGWIKVC